jgi:CheY-like chemotaxis protein
MEPISSSPPRLLLVEPDDSLQSLLMEVLSEVGYAVSMASSLKEAQSPIQEETFALVLAHLYVGRAPAGSFTPAHQLRRLVHPTPVGLLMTTPFSPEDARHAGFAFVLPMPFDLDDLLTKVSLGIQQTLSAEDEKRIQVIERFFAARQHEDWPTLLALCTEDVVYYPFAAPGATTARRMRGVATLQNILAAIGRSARSQVFLHRYYAMLPKGLMARYLRLWTTPEGERRREVEVAYFHFRGEQICQVGMHALLRSFERQNQVG